MALQEEMQTASPTSSEDLRKDVTIKGPGDSEVHTEDDRLYHSYKPHGAAVTRQIQEI